MFNEIEKLWKELTRVKNRLNEVSAAISGWTEGLHATSTEDISDTQSATVDNEITIAQLEARVKALEDMRINKEAE